MKIDNILEIVSKSRTWHVCFEGLPQWSGEDSVFTQMNTWSWNEMKGSMDLDSFWTLLTRLSTRFWRVAVSARSTIGPLVRRDKEAWCADKGWGVEVLAVVILVVPHTSWWCCPAGSEELSDSTLGNASLLSEDVCLILILHNSVFLTSTWSSLLGPAEVVGGGHWCTTSLTLGSLPTTLLLYLCFCAWIYTAKKCETTSPVDKLKVAIQISSSLKRGWAQQTAIEVFLHPR